MQCLPTPLHFYSSSFYLLSNFNSSHSHSLPLPFHLHPLHLLTLYHPCSIEFASHKLDTIITVTHRDVCEEGFNMESTADAGTVEHLSETQLVPLCCSDCPPAVFLDLPEPWRAVDTSRKAIKVIYQTPHGGCSDNMEASLYVQELTFQPVHHATYICSTP